MSFSFTSTRSHRALHVAVLIAALLAPCWLQTRAAFAQKPQQGQSDLSNNQRMSVMKSKLEAMRRSLSSAIAAINSGDKGDKTKNADDPRERLRGLDKEAGSIISEVNDLQVKEDKSEKYDTSKLASLEQSVADLNTRVDAALQATASARTANGETPNYRPKEKSKRRLFGLLPGKKSDKYDELTGTVAPGRDRTLFIEAAKEVRKGNHETGRLLFTTIINTYPDSAYLPLAKLAIADSFYLEGTTAALTQAGQAYEDWRTFFPTDQLADDALLKVAETEMRQMGLSDRDISHARKAEQRLKALLQRYPQSELRPTAEAHLREVQDNLAMHNLQVARFYGARFENKHGGLKGEQDRLREITEKYPNFCLMDEVLFRLGWTFQQEEEPDEAAKLYQQLVRDYPNSEYVEKAKEQLNVIGATIPDADPIKKGIAPCEKPGFMANMMQQITGNANITTNHDGILITHDGEGTDLIDRAIANGGELPDNVQPIVHTSTPSTANRPRTTATPSATPKP